MKSTRPLLIILTLISVIGISLGTYTFFHRAATEHVYVYNCGLVDFKPTSLTQFCADTGAGVRDIKWVTWSESGASGTGQYAINLCEPNCAAGKWKFADVKVRLSKSVHDQNKIVLSHVDIVSINGKSLPQSTSPKLGWDLERTPLSSVK
ncbi:MAG: hypothetical protein Q8L08_10390 [Candidatus Nanopelagicaceae bacterium]|nr:hypothetical protein [Candidatus Nanopelagicaceae bacterium]